MKTEIVKNQPFAVRMERSYVNCLYQGMRMGLEHAGVVWKSTWPMFLVSVLLPFPLCLLCYAAVAALMPKWAEQGTIPAVPAMHFMKQAETWRVVRRGAGMVVLLVVFTVLIAAVAAGVLWGGLPLWGLVVSVPVVLLSVVPLEWCRLELLFGEDTVGRCFARVGMGVRYGGRLFAFYTLCGLCFLVVGLLAATPLLVQGVVVLQMMYAREMGDVANVPVAFWPLLVLAYVLFQAVLYHLYIVSSHAEYLLWGSITAGEADARLVEKVPADTEAEG